MNASQHRSAARLTQRVPWLCVPLLQEVCPFQLMLIVSMDRYWKDVKWFYKFIPTSG